jgi:hypothetical protein
MPADPAVKPKRCTACGGYVNDAYVCRRCANQTIELLTSGPNHAGITWLHARVFESAYRQAKLGDHKPHRNRNDNFYNLGYERAIRLLNEIERIMRAWHAQVTKNEDAVDVETAAHTLAAALTRLRHTTDIASLRADLLRLEKTAFFVINRPPNVCCGMCDCGEWLYADDDSDTVRCVSCRAEYSVPELRRALRERLATWLFTSAEILHLSRSCFEKRLPKSTLYRAIKDGRLRPRGERRISAHKTVPLFAFEDISNVVEHMALRSRDIASMAS